jgi:hypothetical protein
MLEAGRLPDLHALRARFAPDASALPRVEVRLPPLSQYEQLCELSEVA